ncbi:MULTISPECIES: hypothetical protein [unclassified Sphingomonas]|uniref:hypothetical protein n=1 Tax=unclassified Sphingomonas TaxID=196159 RepID=UPI001AD163CC|nr:MULTISPECIES: hypothetical protein [unclassified Sphingomonas]MBN8847822.1 hypothetical protein [Sphingomonas sp.]MBS0284715.1 hypothetical protein [Pseudomonadota bacterium]
MTCRIAILVLLALAGCSDEPANVTSRTGTSEVRARPAATPEAQRPNTPAR